MRIAFDDQIFGWQVYGGISRYVCELARALALEQQQEVRVIAPLFVNRHLLEAATDLAVTGRLAPRLPLGGRFYRRINRWLAAPAMARFDPDILHETYYAAAPRVRGRARVVLTVHDMIHERFRAETSPLDPTRREKASAVARADRVICVSENTRRDLLELLDVPPSKISVVHHGFSRLPKAEPWSGNGGRPFLLYVGHRGRYKNFAGLLQACAASPLLRGGLDLICFGGGPPTRDERRLVRQLGLRGLGVRQVSGDDALLASLYRGARAFVYPSLYEGFGIPPLEAMSLDCPVVCSNASSIPEVVGDAAELFAPQDPEAMGAAIERVVGDEERRSSLILRGRERVGGFSWSRCAAQTLDVYRALV